MENDEISKKDLLDLTGISYGQLYRWKRKKLIPEEWFIRKSTFTGQETFFPRDKILDRIDKIMNMKDGILLDDLAQVFSPQLVGTSLKAEELLKRNIITSHTLELYWSIHGENNVKNDFEYAFEQLLCLYVLEEALASGEATIEECKTISDTFEDSYKKFNGKSFDIILVRKFGVSICLISISPNEFFLEKGAKKLLTISLDRCIEKLKQLLAIN
jgi:hypothetical protein